MKATCLVYPNPRKITHYKGVIGKLSTFSLTGTRIPTWLKNRMACACRASQVRLVAPGGDHGTIRCQTTTEGFNTIKDKAFKQQAYCLKIAKDGNIIIRSPGASGMQYGVITLCQLLEAKAAGAELEPTVIRDSPVFGVRGIQIDLARDFHPPLDHLKQIIDRLVEMKMNTLWLYLENHFRVPGMQDISPPRGLTPRQAKQISDYGARRGIDIVPGTNVVSHMEGWLRLERYSDLADGPRRSYPVLTHKDTWPLVRKYIDAMMDAFGSPNFHVGLDELLITGYNPQADAAISRKGKIKYFSDFVTKVVRHIQNRGKTLWLWDDMVAGKNVYRPEGFNQHWRQALAAIPKDAVLVHWWYWGPQPHGMTQLADQHPAMIKRVASLQRPLAIAPTSQSFRWSSAHVNTDTHNQCYMAKVGRKHGAFAYICTHWESANGSSLEATWPMLALSAGQAWHGASKFDDRYLRALAFTTYGTTTNAFSRYLSALGKIEDVFAGTKKRNAVARKRLFTNGPYGIWRLKASTLTPGHRKLIRNQLRSGTEAYQALNQRPMKLARALELPLILFKEIVNILDAFDQGWGHYHYAAKVEHNKTERKTFTQQIELTIENIQSVCRSLGRLERAYKSQEPYGHTPYDAYALAQHRKVLREHAIPLIRKLAAKRIGLPYFEKIFFLPDVYRISNPEQFRYKEDFFRQYDDCPWPVRWADH